MSVIETRRRALMAKADINSMYRIYEGVLTAESRTSSVTISLPGSSGYAYVGIYAENAANYVTEDHVGMLVTVSSHNPNVPININGAKQGQNGVVVAGTPVKLDYYSNPTITYSPANQNVTVTGKNGTFRPNVTYHYVVAAV